MKQLFTERLQLQEISMKHLPDVHYLHSIPEVDRYNTLGIPANEEVTKNVLKDWLQRQQSVPRASYIFHISAGETFIGIAGMNFGKPAYRIAEIWYKLDPAHWGKGFATETVLCMLQFGFKELGLHRIEAGCAIENIASQKVLEKSGMTLEGCKRSNLPIRGNWSDSNFFSILENEFISSR